MQSMTGFAALSAEAGGRTWRWEARSVNGRGLELRFRLAEGTEGLEPELRAEAARRLARGSVSVALRPDDAAGAARPAVNAAALEAALAAAQDAEARAAARGLGLRPSSAAEILALRGVMEAGAGAPDEAAPSALRESFGRLLGLLAAARAEEGARLRDALSTQVDEIAALAAEARAAFAAQTAGAAARLAAKVAQLQDAGAATPPERLAQELALLAVKTDVSEELDRLDGHVAAARDLLAAAEPVGRRLDFLTQEFNREANTLCAKAAGAALGATGLALKVAVDRLREQAANVE